MLAGAAVETHRQCSCMRRVSRNTQIRETRRAPDVAPSENHFSRRDAHRVEAPWGLVGGPGRALSRHDVSPLGVEWLAMSRSWLHSIGTGARLIIRLMAACPSLCRACCMCGLGSSQRFFLFPRVGKMLSRLTGWFASPSEAIERVIPRTDGGPCVLAVFPPFRARPTHMRTPLRTTTPAGEANRDAGGLARGGNCAQN